MRLGRVEIAGILMLVIIVVALWVFAPSSRDSRPVQGFGTAGVDVFIETQDGRIIELKSDTLTLVYAGQPVSAVYFRPWVQGTAEDCKMTFTYRYTYRVYTETGTIRRGTGGGVGPMCRETELFTLRLSDRALIPYVQTGRTTTVAIEVVAELTWFDEEKKAHKKTIRIKAGVELSKTPDDIPILEKGIFKEIEPA